MPPSVRCSRITRTWSSLVHRWRRFSARAPRPSVTPNAHTPMKGPAPAHATLQRLIGFGRYLRFAGLPVGTGRILTFCRAATVLDPLDRTDLRLAALTT